MNPQSAMQTLSTTPKVDARLWMISLVCFCVMAVDGFDTASIAYVAPTLALQWKVAHAALTPAFVMTSVGAVIGYLLSGGLVARYRRRNVIVLTMIAFALLSAGTAFAGSIMAISVMRFMTSICLGCVAPATISCTVDHAPEHRRATATIVAGMGLSAGAALGGLLASWLIAHYGWRSVFITGGALPLVLVPIVWSALRGSDASEAVMPPACDALPHGDARPRIGALFQRRFALSTVLIWAIAFLSFLVTYQFVFWVPTLLVSYGFSAASASLGSTASSIGGIAGSLALVLFVGRCGLQRSLMILACLAIACIAWLGLGGVDQGAVLLLIAGVGAGTMSGCVGQAALAVLLYPSHLRTTGVGCAAAAGRIGAIVGPATGGALFSLGFTAQQIVLTSCLPCFVIIALLTASKIHSARASEAGK
ncbi:MFS transporter [Paraburkholderia sediminicola]|uniref:MFS transporter n=1 Tax=Paraburkholderia sediminicola TaxID=458836 RepID=UPI0038B74FD4